MKSALIAFLFILTGLGLLAWIGVSSGGSSVDISAAGVGQMLTAGISQLGVMIHEFREEVIAVGTVVLAFATAFLFIATRDLVKGAEQASRQQLRAYVHITSAKVANFTSNNGATFTISVRNFGQTPAYRANIWLSVDTVPFPADITLLPKNKTPRVKNGCIGPGAEQTLTARSASFSPTVIADLTAGAKATYVHGVIEYQDTFGAHRATNFCFFKGGNLGIAGSDLYNDDIGNEAR